MKTLILILFTSIATSQTIDYNEIEERPELLSKNDFTKELFRIEDLDSYTSYDVSFIVNSQGNITNINAIEPIKKALILLGKWTTPKDKGKPVNCSINFKLKVR